MTALERLIAKKGSNAAGTGNGDWKCGGNYIKQKCAASTCVARLFARTDHSLELLLQGVWRVELSQQGQLQKLWGRPPVQVISGYSRMVCVS